MNTFFKKRIKSIPCFLLILICSFGIFALPASAATTSSQKVVSYSAVSGGKINQLYHTYYIKGNLLSKKTVKILGVSNFPNKDVSNSFAQLAAFDVKVHDKNGKLISEYRSLKLGSSFTLPRGNQTYTIYIASKFYGYKINNSYHQSAAIKGTLYLKY